MINFPVFNQEVKEATAEVYEKLRRFIPEIEWPSVAPFIYAIRKLKKEKNAVILAHNYMTPDIFHGVADIVGDSLALAREAAKVEARILVLCGVHFMAETAKVINPSRKVLIPDTEAGCSLAESITPEDVAELRRKHPGVPVVTYVNTSAAVKAASDICCTSGNAVEVVESLPGNEVIFIPDQYLAANVAKLTKKKVHIWEGSCMVHELFTKEDIQGLRESYPGVTVMSHPECPPEVVDASDFSGSTSGMQKYVEKNQPKKIALITECSMSDNLAAMFPKTEFIRPCNLCPHMKKITLAGTLACLQNEAPEVTVEEKYLAGAKLSIDRMLAIRSK